MNDIAQNLADIKAELPDSTTLIAVSKKQPIARIRAALEAGHRDFGENRIQDAQKIWPALKDEFPDIRLHFIGQLQSNKAEDAATLFDVIHTIDRPKLAKALSVAMDKHGLKRPCFIQVNTGDEEQKGGISVNDLPAFLDQCRDTYNIHVKGLMCLPPQDEAAGLHFALLQKLAKRHGLGDLSMGMSADYQTAIKFGATHIRVGSALFGARE